MNTTTTCTACKALGGIVQCNQCRKVNPNAQTTTRRRVAAMVAQGATVADAEKARGVAGHVTIGR